MKNRKNERGIAFLGFAALLLASGAFLSGAVTADTTKPALSYNKEVLKNGVAEYKFNR